MTVHLQKITHNVLPGNSEYIDEFYVDRVDDDHPANPTMEIYFNHEMVIDDMIISVDVNDASYTITLVYPISNAVLPIISGSSDVTWRLNDASQEAKLWYRIPAWTKLKIVTTLGTGRSATFNICVIGRAA